MVEAKMWPKIKDNEITNLAVVITQIKTCADIELLSDYQEEVIAYAKDRAKAINPNDREIRGMEVLRATLSLRIDELKKDMLKNESVLVNIQKHNPNLGNLSIVKTNRDINDSGRDVEYIKYVNEDGIVRMLECSSESFLKEFLQDNSDLALNGTSKEIFNYFKNHKHASLSFKNIDENTEKETKEALDNLKINDPRINDPNAFVEEKRLIEDFSLRQKNNIIPRIAINSDGERLYTVGETVIKFYDNHGKRKMEIVSSNGYEQEKEEVESELQIETEEEITAAEKQSVLEDETPLLINDSDFKILLANLYNGQGLLADQEKQLELFVKTKLEELLTDTIDYDSKNSLDLYIEYLSNQKDSTDLTTAENAILDRYRYVIALNEEAKKVSESKDNVRALKYIKESNTNAAFISIAVLEGTILLGILISVLALVNR